MIFLQAEELKKRFSKEKERITMFACVYGALRYGRVFYIPNKSVPNTQTVKSDYLIYREISEKGLNLGIKFDKGVFVPFTILVSKSSNLSRYIEDTVPKIVSRLIITDVNTGVELEDILYSDKFIIHTI